MPDLSANSERDLILQVARGSEEAFAGLFDTYRDKLYSFILAISGNAEVSEDVVQDVFLKIWQDKQGLMQIQNFNAYLFRMAHNHILNLLQRKAKEILILGEMARQANTSKEIYADLDFKEAYDAYQKAVESLPVRQKQVFILSRQQGLKQEEIARRLDISVTTVKSHMQSAMRSIRMHCSNSYPDLPVSMWFAIACFFLS